MSSSLTTRADQMTQRVWHPLPCAGVFFCRQLLDANRGRGWSSLDYRSLRALSAAVDATQGPQPSAATSAAPRVVFAKGGVARLPVFTLPTRIVVTSPIRIVVRFVFPHLPPWMLGGRLRLGSRFGLLRRCQGRRRKGSDQDEGNKTFDHGGSRCVCPCFCITQKGRRPKPTPAQVRISGLKRSSRAYGELPLPDHL